jgi:hypothetical protein
MRPIHFATESRASAHRISGCIAPSARDGDRDCHPAELLWACAGIAIDHAHVELGSIERPLTVHGIRHSFYDSPGSRV